MVVACSLVIALFAGCKKDDSPQTAPPPKDPPAKPTDAAQKTMSGAKGGIQKPLSSARVPGAGGIDFANLRDPFKPAVTIAPPADKKAGPSITSAANLLPIQSFETEKFRVVGIITGINENRALMLDPAGKAYVVRKGMAVGNSGGVVTKVNPNSVEITERFQDDSGRVRKRTVKLTLTRKK